MTYPSYTPLINLLPVLILWLYMMLFGDWKTIFPYLIVIILLDSLIALKREDSLKTVIKQQKVPLNVLFDLRLNYSLALISSLALLFLIIIKQGFLANLDIDYPTLTVQIVGLGQWLANSFRRHHLRKLLKELT